MALQLPASTSLTTKLVSALVTVIVLLLVGNAQPTKAGTIVVPNGGNLQAAANAAQCGDTIIVQAGARFVTPGLEIPALILTSKPCSDTSWITIQSENAASLPPTFKNLTPDQLRALNLPKLISDTATPAVEAVAGAHHYRLIGFEITNDSLNRTRVNNALVMAGIRHGSSPSLTLATVPNFIEFDRVWVHSEEDGTDSEIATCLRGFMLGARNITIKNSRVAGFRAFAPGQPDYGQSTQAILIEKGPGPYTIHNNYLEAWFTSIFTGGGPQWISNQATVSNASMSQATLSNVANLNVGDYIAFRVTGQGSKYQVARVTGISGNVVSYVPQGGLPNGDNPSEVTGNPLRATPEMPGDAVWNGDTPRNLRITNNSFYKNPVVGATVAQFGLFGKGHIEFKTVTDGLVEGNEFSGYAAGFTITSRNQSDESTSGNNPWATITNLTFRSNVWRGIYRPGSQPLIGIQLNDNQNTTVQGRGVVFENMLFENLWGPLLHIGGSADVTFRNVTALGGGTPLGEVSLILAHSGANEGFRLENNILPNNEYGVNCPLGSTAACYPNYVVNGNVILDNRTPEKKIAAGPLANTYPAGNFYPETIAQIQFVDPLSSQWGLAATSPYKGLGNNGADPGVDMARLQSALGGILPPPPTPTPTPNPTPTPTPVPTPTPTPVPTPTPTPNPTPTPTESSYFRLSSPTFYVYEGGVSAHLTVTRTYATGAASVDYQTSDTSGLDNCNLVTGAASARCDYTIAFGTLRFADGESAQNISIPIVDDSYPDGNEDFTITLSNPHGASLGLPSVATITIQDRPSNGGNPIDDTAFFVRQQYLDFLNREPDPGSYAAWQQVIDNCEPGDTNCDRIHVSSAFFRSPEFQDRGYFVYRFYPVSFGRKPNYAEFTPDMAKVSVFRGAAELEEAKWTFILEFMSRPEFVTKFNALSDTEYVDTLLATAGITSPNRDFWIAALGNGTRNRPGVLREVAESTEVYNRYYNQAFVVMQYFGYLRRDPDASYLDWIDVLNSSGDFRGMVNGFLNSAEYRSRSGP